MKTNEWLNRWELLSENVSLIPLNGLVPIEESWQKWCVEKRPFYKEDFQDLNAGIACGPASNALVLIDYDGRLLSEKCKKNNWIWPETPIVAAKPFHFYFSYPKNGQEYPTRYFEELGIGIFGIDGLIVAPGSIDPKTGRRIVVSRNCPLPDPPEWLLDLYEESSKIEIIAEEIEEKSLIQSVTQDLVFPNLVMSGVGGEYASLMAQYIEAPIQFPYFAFLTCLGSILSGRLTIKTHLKPQPRLYVLILGPSGESRKSTTIKHAIDFFSQKSMSDLNFKSCGGVGSEIGLLRKLKKDNSLLFFLDEFKQLTSKSGITGSNLLPCIATLFDNNTYENQIKKEDESIIVENAHLSILAASTPETYESTWNPEFTNIGLDNRLFIVPGKGNRGIALPPEIPESAFGPIEKDLREIISKVGKNLKLKMTDRGYELYNDWYQRKEDSVHRQRIETYALRLMSLLAVNDLKSEVDDETVKKTIELCDWQLKARELYTPVDADNKFAEMEEKIRRKLKNEGPHTKRELKIATNARRVGIWCFDAALKNLVNAKEVEKYKDGKTERYRLL